VRLKIYGRGGNFSLMGKSAVGLYVDAEPPKVCIFHGVTQVVVWPDEMVLRRQSGPTVLDQATAWIRGDR